MVTIGILPERKKQGISPKKVLLIIQILVWLGGIALLVGLYFIVNRYLDLQKKAEQLREISIYSDAKKWVQQQQFLKELEQKNKIDDVIKMYSDIQQQYDITSQYYDWLQKPYTYFLQDFLLPPLNIWQDKYTGKIIDDLVGQKYLQLNNYLDVNLISQWTDFFKNIGKDSPKNDIKSITVWSIAEQDGGIFVMPIDVNFVAQTKRSFLLLVDKLSMTSNRQNISLLNEFFFHLWTVVKEKNTGVWEMTTLTTTWEQTLLPVQNGNISDQDIGKNMYAWVKDTNSNYISEEDIVAAVKRTANCDAEETVVCYFKFREKMRSLPALAYTVGMPTTNKIKELRQFLINLPPMINVKSFTFQKQTTASSLQDWGKWYEGKLQIEVYGRSMTTDDVSQIASYLWSKCTNNIPLDPEVAIWQLEQTIKQATSVTQISNEKSKQLSDLRTAFTEISKTYAELPGFKKATKLFEIYRMLAENRLCIQK